jgi:hypothetical protein
MFARLTILQVKPDDLDEVVKIYRDKVVPAAKSQKGYKVLPPVRKSLVLAGEKVPTLGR